MLSKLQLQKAVFARSAISLCDKRIVSRAEFLSLLTSGKYTPAPYRMTDGEARGYLDVLKRTRMVVEVGDYVYTDPQSVVDAVHLRGGLPLVSSVSQELEHSRAALSQSLSTSHEQSASAVESAVRGEKEFWAMTALGSGLQMLVLSYLTFQVYGWDVMEPVTFFVTTGTALCSYAYFLYFRKEHSYEHVDDSLLPYRLARELSKSSVKADRVIRDIRLSQELERVIGDRDKRPAKLVVDALRK